MDAPKKRRLSSRKRRSAPAMKVSPSVSACTTYRTDRWEDVTENDRRSRALLLFKMRITADHFTAYSLLLCNYKSIHHAKSFLCFSKVSPKNKLSNLIFKKQQQICVHLRFIIFLVKAIYKELTDGLLKSNNL